MKRVPKAQLERWHVQGQYQQIVDAIEAIPAEQRGYELTGLLARAYNNLARFDRALALLFSVEKVGEEDAVWNFRVGYALFHSGQRKLATPYFARVLDLCPDDAEAQDYLSLCTLEANNKLRAAMSNKSGGKHDFEAYANKRRKLPPICYPPDDLAAVRAHIERYYGPITQMIAAPLPRDLHIDLCICAPNAHRDYYLVSTLGMGACPMNLPPEEHPRSPERLELTIALPHDWVFDQADEVWFWPLRWLWTLSHLPFQNNSWLGYGHTISSSEDNAPFAPNTRQSSFLLLGPQDAPAGATACALSDEQKVGFLQLIPLYHEEMQFKLRYGLRALLERMADVDHVVCPYRLNTCAPDIGRPRNPYFLS